MTKPISVTRAQARRFLLAKLGFGTPFASVAAAIEHHGYIQIDPINVCGRMHDLILRNRIPDYSEGDLMRFLHGAEVRSGFEHHLPHTGVLVALPLEAWPHLLEEMRACQRRPGAWSGRLTPRERELAPQILGEIERRGALGPGDFEDGRKSRRHWGQATLVKTVMQKLFFHGKLLIAGRVNNQRRYDLPERVLPKETLDQPEATAAETARWVALLKVRQFRLAALTKAEAAAAGDDIAEVTIEACPKAYCLRSDLPALVDNTSVRPPSSILRLLAPLDPIIYQRKLTKALWDFDYSWEVYTPAHKRVRGYYALPVLAGDELVGHVDPKADRGAGKLRVVSRSVRRGIKSAPAVAALAEFLGLRN